eukprot:tig00021108_g18325.t1
MIPAIPPSAPPLISGVLRPDGMAVACLGAARALLRTGLRRPSSRQRAPLQRAATAEARDCWPPVGQAVPLWGPSDRTFASTRWVRRQPGTDSSGAGSQRADSGPVDRQCSHEAPAMSLSPETGESSSSHEHPTMNLSPPSVFGPGSSSSAPPPPTYHIRAWGGRSGADGASRSVRNGPKCKSCGGSTLLYGEPPKAFLYCRSCETYMSASPPEEECKSCAHEAKPASPAERILHEAPPSPSSLTRVLDEYVIGQSAAKKVLSVAVHGHFLRLRSARARAARAELEPTAAGTSSSSSSSPSSSSGRSSDLEEPLPGDLQKFGLIPEFLGRLPVIAQLAPLSESQLVEVLTRPRNSLLKQYSYHLRLLRSDLAVSREALEAIARRAHARGTGARGLRSIMEGLLSDALHDVPDLPGESTVFISSAHVEDPGLRPTVLSGPLRSNAGELLALASAGTSQEGAAAAAAAPGPAGSAPEPLRAAAF